MTFRKIVIRFCNNIRHFSNEINKLGGGIFFCGGWNFSKSVSVDSTFIREMRVMKVLPFILKNKKVLFLKKIFFKPYRQGRSKRCR